MINSPTYAYTPYKNIGGECMSGSVHYQSGRWVIHVYWQGKRHKIWRDYDTFQPFFTKSRAIKYLGILQKQIEDHDFDPKYWKPDSLVSVRRYADVKVARKRALMERGKIIPIRKVGDGKMRI